MDKDKKDKKDKFDKLLEKFGDIKFRKGKSKDSAEIFLPFKTSTEDIQSIIAACREEVLISWHIIFPEPTEKVPEPEVRIYWDSI